MLSLPAAGPKVGLPLPVVEPGAVRRRALAVRVLRALAERRTRAPALPERQAELVAQGSPGGWALREAGTLPVEPPEVPECLERLWMPGQECPERLIRCRTGLAPQEPLRLRGLRALVAAALQGQVGPCFAVE